MSRAGWSLELVSNVDVRLARFVHRTGVGFYWFAHYARPFAFIRSGSTHVNKLRISCTIGPKVVGVRCQIDENLVAQRPGTILDYRSREGRFGHENTGLSGDVFKETVGPEGALLKIIKTEDGTPIQLSVKICTRTA